MNENSGKPDQEQGLYRKYDVTRLNDPNGKHTDCTYYVLDLDHDPHSVAALLAYAASCEAQYPGLAFDLRHTAAATARKLTVARPEELSAEEVESVSCSHVLQGDYRKFHLFMCHACIEKVKACYIAAEALPASPPTWHCAASETEGGEYEGIHCFTQCASCEFTVVARRYWELAPLCDPLKGKDQWFWHRIKWLRQICEEAKAGDDTLLEIDTIGVLALRAMRAQSPQLSGEKP